MKARQFLYTLKCVVSLPRTMILTEKNLIKYLKSKKFIELNSKPYIKKLIGGWLNPIFAVKVNGKSFVVKQILSKGKKEGGFENLHFPKDRMINEYNALKISKIVSPESVPAVLGVDFENFVILIEYAEKSELMQEFLKKKKMSFKTADSIVNYLIKLHNKTINNKIVEFTVSQESYLPIKYEYEFLRVVCSPEVKEKIKKFFEILKKRKYCLIHGDFNSKNILINKDDSIWAIDFEETAYSDPAHDIGKILAHLILFKHIYNSVDEKEILHIFNKYINNIKFKIKKKLKRAIIIHAASIILTRLEGRISFDFIPNNIKLKLRELAETAILKNIEHIKHFLKST